MMDIQTRDDIHEKAVSFTELLPEVFRRIIRPNKEQPPSELPGQIRVCRVLQQQPMTLTTLSEELRISSSAVTQIADRLENSGYVVRSTVSGDRRVRLLQLTPCGHEMMRRIRETETRQVESALALMNLEEREALLKGFTALAVALRSIPCIIAGSECEDGDTERKNA